MSTKKTRRQAYNPAVREYVAKHGFDPTTVHAVDLSPPRSITVLGEIQWIEYTTRKAFEGDEEFIFHHDFEGEKKPSLAEGEGRYFIVGGGYTVTDHGIEDDDSDQRTTPADKSSIDLNTPELLSGMGIMYGVGYSHRGGGLRELFWSSRKKPSMPRSILAWDHKSRGKQLWIVPLTGAAFMGKP